MKYQIRDLRLDDIDAYHEALDSVCRERVYLNSLEAYPMEKVREYLGNNLDNGYPSIVAEANGSVVGFAEFVSDGREGFRHAANLGMAVIKEYRGLGVGEALLDQIIERAIGKGYTRLDLEVFATNKTAINLYKKKGFKEEGVKRKVRYIDGEYQDSIVMAKLVGI